MLTRILNGFLEIICGLFDLLILAVPIIFSLLLFSVLMIVMWVPVAIFQGYSLVLLWQWFIIPIGVPILTLKSAIGVSLIINLLTAHLNEISTKQEILDHAFYWFVGQLLILSAGYIVKTMFI